MDTTREIIAGERFTHNDREWTVDGISRGEFRVHSGPIRMRIGYLHLHEIMDQKAEREGAEGRGTK